MCASASATGFVSLFAGTRWLNSISRFFLSQFLPLKYNLMSHFQGICMKATTIKMLCIAMWWEFMRFHRFRLTILKNLNIFVQTNSSDHQIHIDFDMKFVESIMKKVWLILTLPFIFTNHCKLVLIYISLCNLLKHMCKVWPLIRKKNVCWFGIDDFF